MNLIERITGKSPAALFTDVTTAAKTRVSSNIAKNAANNPAVQQDIKEGIGQKVGVWLIDNYKMLLVGAAVLFVGLYFLRRR